MDWSKFDKALAELQAIVEHRDIEPGEVLFEAMGYAIADLQQALCNVRYQFEKPQLDALRASK